jgi:hypothetical protein
VCGSTINTPSEAKKALSSLNHRKLFFAERVAVLRSLTATADREARRNDEKKGCERVTATEQNKNFSPLGVPIEVDGWRLSNRQNTSGGGCNTDPHFSCGLVLQTK